MTAKRTVDDRALNRPVVDTVRDHIAKRPRAARIVELGGGPGTMVDRCIEWGLVRDADYTLVDLDEACIREAEHHRDAWAAGRTRSGTRHDARIRVQTERAEVEAWLRGGEDRYDLVIANAVLDLVDVGAVLPAMLNRLHPDGMFWLSINYDGETIFEPPHEHDAPVIDCYHRSMGHHRSVGRPLGDAWTGRRMFHQLDAAGARLCTAGSSDWVVFPRENKYVADEAYFLHHIVETIRLELAGDPKLAAVLPEWTHARRAQIEAGTLVYIAHQLDFAGLASA